MERHVALKPTEKHFELMTVSEEKLIIIAKSTKNKQKTIVQPYHPFLEAIQDIFDPRYFALD